MLDQEAGTVGALPEAELWDATADYGVSKAYQLSRFRVLLHTTSIMVNKVA
jgi:hypothetical protein